MIISTPKRTIGIRPRRPSGQCLSRNSAISRSTIKLRRTLDLSTSLGHPHRQWHTVGKLHEVAMRVPSHRRAAAGTHLCRLYSPMHPGVSASSSVCGMFLMAESSINPCTSTHARTCIADATPHHTMSPALALYVALTSTSCTRMLCQIETCSRCTRMLLLQPETATTHRQALCAAVGAACKHASKRCAKGRHRW
jgi:hypothetical protein